MQPAPFQPGAKTGASSIKSGALVTVPGREGPNLHSSKFQTLRPSGHLRYHHESAAEEKHREKLVLSLGVKGISDTNMDVMVKLPHLYRKKSHQWEFIYTHATLTKPSISFPDEEPADVWCNLGGCSALPHLAPFFGLCSRPLWREKKKQHDVTVKSAVCF